MSSLEVLLKAEATLMDPDEPFDFAEWPNCTCGHIYHGVTGDYSINAIHVGRSEPYDKVMKEVAEALGLVGWNGEHPDYPHLISEYTKQVSGLPRDSNDPYNFPYSQVTREDSLKVIREAIAKIREMDQEVIKSIDAHTYEVV